MRSLTHRYKLKTGRHRLRARVTFTSTSATKPRTLQLVFRRCR